jgi:hypothetical protein
MRLLRVADLIVLAVALPVFIAASLPILGWATTTVAWVAARGFQSFVERRARVKGTRQAALGARAATLLGRLYLVTIAVLAAGLIDHKAGVGAGVLAALVFSVYFVTLFVEHAIEGDAR